MDRWTADRIADQSGRTFIVTGASSGLGFETSRQLAAHGGRVVMASRSQANGRDAVARIRAAQPAAAVEFRVLDLADLDSVRAFAAAIVAVVPGGGTGADVVLQAVSVIFLGALAWAMLRGDAGTIWLGWLALLVAAFNCVAVWIGVTFSSYHGHAWLIIGWGAYVGFLVVMLIASISLLRHAGDAPRAVLAT